MVSDEPREDRCAKPTDGGYCEGWQMDNGRCSMHGGQNYNGGAPESNGNAEKHALTADPKKYHERQNDAERECPERPVFRRQ